MLSWSKGISRLLVNLDLRHQDCGKIPEPQGFQGAHIIKQEDNALIDEERLAHDNKRLHTIPPSS